MMCYTIFIRKKCASCTLHSLINPFAIFVQTFSKKDDIDSAYISVERMFDLVQ